MKFFIAASYSSKVDYASGEVFPDFKHYLEGILAQLEAQGHTVFCAMREDGYKINKDEPVAAYHLDLENIQNSDALLAIVDNDPSTGVQTEIGIAVALGKRVFLAHEAQDALAYFNNAMVRAGAVTEIILPLDASKLA